MLQHSELMSSDIAAYLKSQEEKSLLRFITCGSVDDGKSTLIGRMLYESKLIFEDQLAALERDSKKVGTQGGEIDFALLVDGLAAEREQGITIDVAYRFFSTEHRKFIVADTPGHEQYTRNMATGASTADLAVLVLDARKGVLTQTKRHSTIVSLLGIRHIVAVVNKMDLIGFDESKFRQIEQDYLAFAESLGLKDVTVIPISALKGDNVTERSANTDWYYGPTLMALLESIQVEREDQAKPFRMPVQWVNRPNLDFRGFSGLIVSGKIKPGDEVVAMPSGKKSSVQRVVTYDGDIEEAVAGESVTITLADEIDISRGTVICPAKEAAQTADQFEATVLWMAEDHLLPGRSYLMKMGPQTCSATLAAPKYRLDINTLEHVAAKTLELNEIGFCNLSCDRNLAFDPYKDIRQTGGFILIDRLTNNTVGMGLINFALRRSTSIQWQALDINKESRREAKGHKSFVLWFTGLSGAGKSTIANLVEKRLFASNLHTYTLDGDNVRHGLNRDLGFTDLDRVENIRRVAEVSRLMVDAGMIVLVSFISPFRAERRMARDLLAEGEFLEVHVDTPLEIAEGRDVKGLYQRARRGEIKNFTGIDSPYEAPENAEIRVDTTAKSAEEAAEEIIALLKERGLVPDVV